MVKSKALKRLEPWPDDIQLLVVDLEATCDARGFPRAERETIEIGAVLVEPVHLEVVKEFQSFVRPVRHPHLTDYCRELTGIEQHDVDAAPSFPDVSGVCRSDAPRRIKRVCIVGRVINGSSCEIAVFKARIRHRLTATSASSLRRAVLFGGIHGVLCSLWASLESQHHRGIGDARNLADSALVPWTKRSCPD